MEITDSRDAQPLKRRASPEPEYHDEIPKRSRYDSDEDDRDRSRRRSRSPSFHRDRPVAEETVPERRPPVATQEDKKRGKRLFGGLLNTLNQGPSSSQQKRRQEIEKRQKERMQKQATEDGQRRAERLAQLRTVRIREQIVLDEEVVCGCSTMLLAADWLTSCDTDAKPTHKEAGAGEISNDQSRAQDCRFAYVHLCVKTLS